MKEVDDFDPTFENENTEESHGTTQPAANDVQLAVLTLLMRNYDVLMAILAGSDPDKAAELWDLHNEGNTANPLIWMVDPQDDGKD